MSTPPTVFLGAALLAATLWPNPRVPNGFSQSTAQVPERQAEEGRATFRARADLVALAVVATDERLQAASGLAAEDFVVFEDGVKQTIEFFAAERVPLDLAILLDTSSSMSSTIQTARTAAIGLLRSLQPEDRATVIRFNNRAEVLHPLDDRLKEAQDTIRRIHASGGTALHDALYVAMSTLVADRNPAREVRRQAIAVLSDGRDTSSLISGEDVLELGIRTGVAVYAILLSRPRPFAGEDNDALWMMRRLSRETGAQTFMAPDGNVLDRIYKAIAVELGQQYMLGYYSTNSNRDGAFRRVSVEVAGRSGWMARTRAGYLAAGRR